MQSVNFSSDTRVDVRNTSSRKAQLALAAMTAVALVTPQFAQAASDTWSGTTNSLWSLNTNWLGGNVPGTGDTATFANAGNGNTTIDLGGGVTTSTLLFTSASVAGYTIGSGGPNAQLLTLNDGGAINVDASVGNAQTIDAGVVLGTTGGATTVTFANNGGQPLSFTGTITGSTGAGLKTLAVAGSSNTSISGVIGNGTGGGSVGLSKTGTGSLTLSGTNTYSGGSTITTGTVIVTNASGLGTGSVNVGATGTAFLNNDQTGSNFTYANNFTGTGLIKVQPNGLALGDTTVLTGDMSGFTGTLQVLPGFFNNGYVNLGQTTQATTPGAGSIIKIDSGASLFLNKTLLYASNIEVAGNGNTDNKGAIRFEQNAAITGNVALLSDSTFHVTANGGRIEGQVSGAFGFTKRGSTFSLTNANNTYTGTTTIADGTLSVGNGGTTTGSLGSGPVFMSGNGTLRFNLGAGSPYTYAGNITSTFGQGIINNQGVIPVTLSGTSKIDNFFRVWGGGETIITGSIQVGDETANTFNQGWTSIGILNGNPPQPGPGILTIAAGGSYSGMGTSDGGIPNSLIGGAITGTASINVNGGTLLFGGR
ncbi:MAG: autotransporter-associated beta strand repeat-containing protein, partial [Burkholderiales bacterium]|nr:autotransporter-associated beta strand repeat-containing protein [Phycisphaerae bacterium]